MKRILLPDSTIPILMGLDGLLLILFAIFAYEFGFDHEAAWGRFRFGSMILGSCLVIFSSVIFLSPKINNHFLESVKTNAWLKQAVFIFHIWAAIFLIYAWFITFGTFTEWRKTTQYYTQLADAFAKAQLHVDAHPGEALLNAEDPYSSNNRPAFDDEIWDLSLYKEKLYLYWGPVPALLITPIQVFTGIKITDIFLVYFFYCGLLIVNSLLILKLRRLFLPEISAKTVLVSIFLLGFILPIPWSLNIPDVYESAIGAGQFFLLGGMYFAICAFDKGMNKRLLFFSGLFFACSVGSRAINFFSVLFLTLLILYWLLKSQPKPIPWKQVVPNIVLFLTPLAFGALLIGWYNWARFDSPLEFGLRYQITIYNLNQQMNLVFQPDYFFLNIYAYFFQPFEVISQFPFIQPVEFSNVLQRLNITAPGLYAAGPITGILFYAPFLLYALVPFRRKQDDIENTSNPELLKLTRIMLGGSLLIGLATILFFFYAQMRYMVDVISQVTVLAILGYWSLKQKANAAKIKLHIANLLILFTLMAGILLSFSSETHRMEKSNPALMETIKSFFTIDR
ncbi:MAG: hypothetical protein J0M11_01195 [Anaerolineae bacterium]|nr:hypothetical protein [Anaerolineae bacterium]